ncbi:Dol-P-Man:Man(5)GlcNAc(2)-PP-Dol alpha-1,3-mannosyltransferase [Elysia marginata]|uniref:dolichyl-P-Man:Man5GlcNAc2-PP-dolichol alpha-1,3-mannosyltransferase n=1 Tax=Elysia marginata TaxID=1093978 RepID=A0AAV4J681_9GAST|nr:Dol-P-Man:Man(5)GlcNAc(2)-PP-Dol alpha-1,3-mannosyltransferase [Elysia marginata]
MAPSMQKMQGPRSFKSHFEIVKRLILDPSVPLPAMAALLIAEILVNATVIWKIKYTEIDWVAYMQEVEGVVNGTYDYMQLRGDTGPLVYPAGFVYVFMGLYYVTNLGSNLRLAQYIFMGLYLLNLVVVFDIYRIVKRVPPYVFFFMCALSYRIHSIYVLRLFNDPVAMLFLYMAIDLFLRGRWAWGCLLYSLGVSIKMNLLLFAPGLLFLLLVTQGIQGTLVHLTICALPQLILALPFLLTNPVGYVVRSFDLGRQFFYKWTVNWRFLPQEVFLNRYFQATLLLAHILVLLAFFWRRWRPMFVSVKLQWSKSGLKQKLGPHHILLKDYGLELAFTSLTSVTLGWSFLNRAVQVLFPLFTANLIGMSFSRSLHYQFYVWYFHSLHYLVWCCPYPPVLRILILGVIEMSWNTYPSTVSSSALLHVCHGGLLIGLWLCNPRPSTVAAVATHQKSPGQGESGGATGPAVGPTSWQGSSPRAQKMKTR